MENKNSTQGKAEWINDYLHSKINFSSKARTSHHQHRTKNDRKINLKNKENAHHENMKIISTNSVIKALDTTEMLQKLRIEVETK